MTYDAILRSLANREVIIPYLENAILSQEWPESYTITIDSGPYYGAGDGYFHPSTHPLMGERQLYYLFHPDHQDDVMRERPSMKRELTLAMGSALHGILQAQFMMTGLVKPENVEVEYVNRDHHVRGRIDFIVDHPDGRIIPVEMKTMTNFKFSKQAEIKPEWDAQLSLALDACGQDTGILLLLESGFPYGIKEFIVPRNDVLLSEIYAKFARVREAIALNRPPLHCCAKDSPQMTSCPARFACWLKDDKVDSIDLWPK